MSFRDYWLAGWKTGAVALEGLILAWLATQGIHLPAGWNMDAWVTMVASAAGAAVWSVVINYLQSRTGSGAFATACRAVGRILALGVLAVPVYVKRVKAPASARLDPAQYRRNGL